jgi:hypothetical protein
MKQFRVMVLGVVLVLIGVVIMALAFAPEPSPPVDVLFNQSGIATANGVYFDSIMIRNHGTSNVTVVVEVQTSLDTKPRLSDPITLCGGCTGTVTVEELQSSQNQTPDQYAYYTYAITNPQSIRVEYLSTVLQSRSSVFYPEAGAAIVIVGVFLLIHEVSRPSRKSSTPRSSSGRRGRFQPS